MSVLTDIGGKFTGAINLSGVGKGIAIFLLMIVVAGLLGGIAYVISRNRRFNKNIIDFESVAGRGYIPARRDKAMLVKIGDHGEELLYLRKGKTYRTAYGKQYDKNSYAFAKGSDGMWYNITFGDLDQALKIMNIQPTDTNMRMMYSGIRRNIKDSFEKKPNWFKENIGLLVGITSIILVLLFMWLLADKYFGIIGRVDHTVEVSGQVMEKASAVLSAIDNICSGSGIREVAT